MDQVKHAFVKLALQTHPDKEGGSAAKFLLVRQAFEAIQQQEEEETNGGGGGPMGWSAQELQEWWRQEMGEFLSFDMSEDTRHEVIRAYHTMGPSAGRDKGGYWEMARQLAEREEANNNKNGNRNSNSKEEVHQHHRMVTIMSTTTTTAMRVHGSSHHHHHNGDQGIHRSLEEKKKKWFEKTRDRK